MTDERMALLERVEKGVDADLMREMLGFAADRIMEAEVAAGAAKGARSPLREAYLHKFGLDRTADIVGGERGRSAEP
jgi:hypothetical protein